MPKKKGDDGIAFFFLLHQNKPKQKESDGNKLATIAFCDAKEKNIKKGDNSIAFFFLLQQNKMKRRRRQ
jgi:hypothetical protein